MMPSKCIKLTAKTEVQRHYLKDGCMVVSLENKVYTCMCPKVNHNHNLLGPLTNHCNHLQRARGIELIHTSRLRNLQINYEALK